MAMIVTSDLIELTKIGLGKIYMNEVDAPGQIYQDLYEVQTSDKALEEELKMAGFGSIPKWNSDGGRISYDKPLTSDRIYFSHTDFALGWVLSHKMLREDLYKKTSKDLVTAVGLSTKHSIEQDGANLFINGFTVNGPDGVPLFNANHPLLGGGVQSNLLAGVALSESAVQTAIGTIKRAKNDRQQPIVYTIDAIVVPPELEFVAAKILNVTDRPEAVTGASSGFAAVPIQNVFKGIIPRIIVWPYLTGTSTYFILASKAQRRLKFWWRERPWYDADKDFETKGVANSVAYAYSVGYAGYEGVWGSLGTGG